jgi:hypothetical protein
VPEFQGKMRLSANPFDLVGADIEVSAGNLALIVSDHEIGQWPLETVSIDAEPDGFHMRVDGEEFVFTTREADEFAAAVGISRFGARTKKSGKSTRTVKMLKAPALAVQTAEKTSLSKAAAPAPTKPKRPASRAPKRKRPVPFRRVRALFRTLNLSSLKGQAGAATAVVVVVLAIVARPVLATILLFVGMAGILLIGAVWVDPVLATRLPEDWPARRLVPVALGVIAFGLLLVAF